MDLFPGKLQCHWKVWVKNHWIDCVNLSGNFILQKPCYIFLGVGTRLWDRHVFILSMLQAASLLLFNNADRLSYSEIMTQLNLTHDDLVRLLHSLSCAKYKILIKEPETKTILQTDNFEFNSKFTDRMRRIKVFSFLTFSLPVIFPTVFYLFFCLFVLYWRWKNIITLLS